jgi:hypothetical protein
MRLRLLRPSIPARPQRVPRKPGRRQSSALLRALLLQSAVPDVRSGMPWRKTAAVRDAAEWPQRRRPPGSAAKATLEASRSSRLIKRVPRPFSGAAEPLSLERRPAPQHLPWEWEKLSPLRRLAAVPRHPAGTPPEAERTRTRAAERAEVRSLCALLAFFPAQNCPHSICGFFVRQGRNCLKIRHQRAALPVGWPPRPPHLARIRAPRPA